MNLLERIMLKLGWIKLDLYKERESDSDFYYKAFDEGHEIIDELESKVIDYGDSKVKEYLDKYYIDKLQ